MFLVLILTMFWCYQSQINITLRKQEMKKITLFIQKNIILSFLLLFHYQVLAQESISPKRNMTFGQILEEIKTCKDSVYRLRNAIITLDSSHLDKNIGGFWYKDTLEIGVRIVITDCEWKANIVAILMNVTFSKSITLARNKNLSLSFIKCIFNKFSAYNNEGSFLYFQEDKFLGQMYFVNNQQNTNFNDCSFEFTDNDIFQYTEENNKLAVFSFFNQERIEMLGFRRCKMKSLAKNKHLQISARVNALTFNKVDFGNMVLDLEGTEVSHQTEFIDCKIQEPVGLESVIFYPLSTHIDWKQLASQKACLYDSYEEGAFHLGEKISPKDTLVFKDEANFRNYKAIYATLLNIYKVRGDQTAYNACYVEMKDIETRKYAFDYQQSPTLKNYFTWKLHQFLSTFCDYGTDPVKSILYAFYVILCFSMVYVLFPSENDNLRKEVILKKLDKYIRYFSTEKKLVEMHQEERSRQLAEIEELREKLESSHQKVPFILQIVGYPFYKSSQFYYQLNEWFIKKGEVSEGRWVEQSKKQKVKGSFLISIYFLIFIFSGLIMRILNAVILSINVFVTLGYGGVPATGIAKYLAVIEGLIGWFLLSIFSVSLISQVLN
jgi:hypothetical protein